VGTVGSNLPSLYGLGVSRTVEQDIKVIKDYLHMLTEQVQHVTSHIGDENLEENLHDQVAYAYTSSAALNGSVSELTTSVSGLSSSVSGLTTEYASHAHGSITNAGKIGTTAGLAVVTKTAGAVGALAAGEDGEYLAHDATWKNIFELVYPVGAIYMSVASTNPGTLFPGTTWAAWGAGRVPVGIDSGDTDFDTAEETGGAKTHALQTAELASPSHGPADGGSFYTNRGSGTSEIDGIDLGASFGETGGTGGVKRTSETAAAGSGTAHNNLQPYIVCYMFKRTA
jgi:hypothetical protein